MIQTLEGGILSTSCNLGVTLEGATGMTWHDQTDATGHFGWKAHGGRWTRYGPPFEEGDTITAVVQEGEISFMRNGQPLGWVVYCKWFLRKSGQGLCREKSLVDKPIYLTVGQYMYYVNVGYMPIVFHTIVSPSCYINIIMPLLTNKFGSDRPKDRVIVDTLW